MIFGTVQEHFVANPSLNFIFTSFAAKMCYFNVCSVYVTSHFNGIPECDRQTDRQYCYIKIVHEQADA